MQGLSLYHPGISMRGRRGGHRGGLHPFHARSYGRGAGQAVCWSWLGQPEWAAGGSGLIRIYPETRVLCQEFSLDPLGLIASGALLLTLSPGDSRAPAALRPGGDRGLPHREDCPAGKTGSRAGKGRGERDLPYFARDEITKVFASGSNWGGLRFSRFWTERV